MFFITADPPIMRMPGRLTINDNGKFTLSQALCKQLDLHKDSVVALTYDSDLKELTITEPIEKAHEIKLNCQARNSSFWFMAKSNALEILNGAKIKRFYPVELEGKDLKLKETHE